MSKTPNGTEIFFNLRINLFSISINLKNALWNNVEYPLFYTVHKIKFNLQVA